MRRAVVLIAVLTAVAVLGPAVAPYTATTRFGDHLFAPPTRMHVDGGGLYTHPLRLVDRLERRFAEDTSTRLGLPWSAPPESPVLLLGADALGRDVFSRLLHGARASLGLALLATALTLTIGGLLGAWAGMAGGAIERTVIRIGDVLIVMPALYAIVALRATLPLVLPAWTVVVSLATIFVLLGWPRIARGVWAIVRTEAQEEYVVAAVALGASRWRVLVRHLLPACASYLAVQTALLIPSFVLSEATLSFVGLGFPDDVPSWGTALSDAATLSALTRAPWLLAPAAAIFAVALATNLLLERASRATSAS